MLDPEASKGQFAETRLLLQRLLDTHAYNQRYMEKYVADLDRTPSPTGLDLLTARAFVFAYAGQNDLAIAAFDALVSQKQGRTAWNLNKLAQLLSRRGGKEDLLRAEKLAESGLPLANNNVARWFSWHNLAAIRLQQMKYEAAADAAASGLKELADPRTQAMLDLAQAGAGTRDVVEVQATLIDRGFIAPESLDEVRRLPPPEQPGSAAGIKLLLRMESAGSPVYLLDPAGNVVRS